MKTRILMPGVGVVAGAAIAIFSHTSFAQSSIFSEDFESGTLANWTVVSGAMEVSTAQNLSPANGTYSAYLNSSLDKMYHNFGQELSGATVASWAIYDGGAVTRVFGEIRAYSGAGYGDGTLQNLYAAGKYNAAGLSGELYDAAKYQGRIIAGSYNGWFNLNGAGAPSRSVGWHQFSVERVGNGTFNFYVDGVLGRTFTGLTDSTWDTVALGSVAAGSTAGDGWFDKVDVVPEPSIFALLGSGGGLALLLLYRRRS